MTLRLIALLVTLGGSLPAASLANRLSTPPQGVTSLTLTVVPAFTFAPTVPPSRVRVPPLEQVTLSVPADVALTGAAQWYKGDQPVPGATGRAHLLPLTTSADSGSYWLAGIADGWMTVPVHLEVVAAGHLANLSARVSLGPDREPQIIGFVVAGTTPKRLLFRVVGPSLHAFGLTDVATEPRIAAYDNQGRRVSWGHAAYLVDWPATFAAIGAFPLTGTEREGLAWDYGAFEPGAYTLHAIDEANQGGTALIEVYEMDQGALPSTVTPTAR